VKRLYCLAFLAALCLCATTLSLLTSAKAATEDEPIRFQYAWMYLPDNGLPVFSEAETEVTISPVGKLSDSVQSVQQGLRGYKLQSRSARDDGVAALDIAGQRSWEAVSAVPSGNGIRVLLKRPI